MKEESYLKSKYSIDIELMDEMMDVARFAVRRTTSPVRNIGESKSEEDLKALVGETITKDGIGSENALSLFKKHLIPATIPTDHPLFLSFIPSSPSPSASLFDLVTSSSCINGCKWLLGGGGIFCENEAMRWIVSLANLPKTAFGVFTSGGTAANLSALVTARENFRRKNPQYAKSRLLLITASSSHSSNKSMARVIDCDIVMANLNGEDKLTAQTIQETFDALSDEDKARVFCVIASAGTTNAGVIDDLESVGRWCTTHNIWMHVDAAYGGGAMASPRMRPLFNGVEMANSLTIDPHKWMFTPYDCGAIVYRDMEQAKFAHTQQAPYLDIFEELQKGFNPSDYQIQLSRRVRGLPFWFALATNGTESYGKKVDYAIDLAIYAEEKIKELPYVELVRPRSLSVVMLRRIGWKDKDYIEWSINLHQQGKGFVMPTHWHDETITRFCFLNEHTQKEHIDKILDSMK
ncbi:aminotransferase class V-fold PLP-dependent enzyme [Pasteurella skyensis]|uniref:Aminotransferase class V-fold PLP-dependent enzyme n=1 Tax=Phocoenobacter skyensis TaxID=97481 RepID=A0AAJ6N966_9PAST|nr:aminotransferase class V-fold PLP-dependent enzyme [Pasteurella skyensis]MDP8162496.1 aminotransferase class V-fold PLP-dependent enzyme [Pasteurella skyensis]MDP8172461.1 aminotransferase class V-fold PLP-dependent enzyme [Pasteurella skyensis]MDP8177486.1 aminotransferase class V-fold PLP-dependent enzyme [Pasteurella skyensis]MDP8178716.1 aminotransferase class V-fold PLP-dependent enzyme [Pasteurella skyensis]MDP8182994.1 aminotransferase class V-fold PLP-dependent enzyme [Pasteurella s